MAAMPSTPPTTRPAPAVAGPELVGLAVRVELGVTVTEPNEVGGKEGVYEGVYEGVNEGLNDGLLDLVVLGVGSSVTGQTVVVTMISVVTMVLWLGQLGTVVGH